MSATMLRRKRLRLLSLVLLALPQGLPATNAIQKPGGASGGAATRKGVVALRIPVGIGKGQLGIVTSDDGLLVEDGPNQVVDAGDGTYYVCDKVNGYVKRFGPGGRLLFQTTHLEIPMGFCVGPGGSLYVESQRIVRDTATVLTKFDRRGKPEWTLGLSEPGTPVFAVGRAGAAVALSDGPDRLLLIDDAGHALRTVPGMFVSGDGVILDVATLPGHREPWTAAVTRRDLFGRRLSSCLIRLRPHTEHMLRALEDPGSAAFNSCDAHGRLYLSALLVEGDDFGGLVVRFDSRGTEDAQAVIDLPVSFGVSLYTLSPDDASLVTLSVDTASVSIVEYPFGGR